jgi:hypothetical protein
LSKKKTAPVKNAPANDTQATKNALVKKPISKRPASSRPFKENGSAPASNKMPISQESVQTHEDTPITIRPIKPRMYVFRQKMGCVNDISSNLEMEKRFNERLNTLLEQCPTPILESSTSTSCRFFS